MVESVESVEGFRQTYRSRTLSIPVLEKGFFRRRVKFKPSTAQPSSTYIETFI